jgi:PAS domain-containing protein
MRDRGQVFLLIFLICIGTNIVCTNDLIMHSIGLYDPMGREFLTNLNIIASWVFALFFTYYFLELDINGPGFKVPFVIIGSALLFILVYSLIDYTLVHFTMPLIGSVVLSAILIAGLYALSFDASGSMVHVVAFTCFLAGVMAEPAYVLGYLITPSEAHNVTYIAFSLSAMMFSIVVATQFAARQEEKEKALAISNERFMLATKGSNEGLFDWNLSTGEIFFSDQFRRIVGLRIPNDSEGLKKWLRLMLPADRRAVTDTVRRFRRNAKASALNVEYRIEMMNGDQRWLHSKAVAMRDRNTHRRHNLAQAKRGRFTRKRSAFPQYHRSPPRSGPDRQHGQRRDFLRVARFGTAPRHEKGRNAN